MKSRLALYGFGLLIATFSSLGCFEDAAAASIQMQSAPKTMNGKVRAYSDAGLVISDTRVLPPDLQKIVFRLVDNAGVAAQDVSPVTIYYRSGERQNLDASSRLNTAWQTTSALHLDAAALSGKLVQFALAEEDFASAREFGWSFQSDLGQHFGKKFVSREDWGARAPRSDIDDWSEPQTTFVIHHTAGQADSSLAAARKVEQVHREERKDTFADVGYHYMIAPDGTIYEGRSRSYQGAHVKGHNRYTVGIAGLGCFDKAACDGQHAARAAEVSDAMVQSFGELIGFLAHKQQINSIDNAIKGARELGPHLAPSPGDLMQKMGQMKSIATNTLKALKAGPAVWYMPWTWF